MAAARISCSTFMATFTPFSSNAGLIWAASARPAITAKHEEKKKFDRYRRNNLVPFVLETSSRPGCYAQKFIISLFSDAEFPPVAVRDALTFRATTT